MKDLYEQMLEMRKLSKDEFTAMCFELNQQIKDLQAKQGPRTKADIQEAIEILDLVRIALHECIRREIYN